MTLEVAAQKRETNLELVVYRLCVDKSIKNIYETLNIHCVYSSGFLTMFNATAYHGM